MRFSTLAVVTAFAVSAGAADVKKRVRRADMRKEILQRRVRAEAEDVAIEDAMSMPDAAAPEKQEPANGPHYEFPDMASLEEMNGWTGDGHGSADCSTQVIDDFESGVLGLNWDTEGLDCNRDPIADAPELHWRVVTAAEAATTGGCAPGSTRCAQSGDLQMDMYSRMMRPVTFTKDVILEFNVYCVSMGMDHCSFYFVDGNLDENQVRQTIFNALPEEDTTIDWDDLIAHYKVVIPPGTYMLVWEVDTDNWGGDSATFMRVDNIKVTPLHCEEEETVTTSTPPTSKTPTPSDDGHKPWGFWGHVFGH